MTTNKEIATISYNSEAFLKMKLDSLVKSEVIMFYIYIKHYAEGSEKKDHFHIYMQPYDKVDTKGLKKQFDEIDLNNPKPLGCLPIRKSNFQDWYLYGLHNEFYLASKGQFKKYQYEYTDMITNDEDMLNCLIEEMKPLNRYQEMIILQKKGFSFTQYVAVKNIPFNQYNSARTVWNDLLEITKKADEECLEDNSNLP